MTKLPIYFLAEFDPLKSVVAAPLYTFSLWRWTIVVSNHMFMVALATVFLLVFLPLSVRQKGLVPRGMRNLIESVCEYLRENVARPILGDHTDTYVGFIWSVFFFILCLNLLPMVPTDKIVQLITGRENHFGGPATANIWITGAMASVVFFMTLICGIRQQGLWRFLANLAPPVPWWISPLIYALEIVAAFVRPFALAIRLFANMVAGHAVLAAFLGLIFVFRNYGVAVASVLSTVALSFLELLVAFVQAYIFTLLAALYIGFSIEPEH